MNCPNCNSKETRKHGFRLLSGGTRKQQYQCKSCGKVFVPKEGNE